MDGSTRVVYAALAGNLLVAVSKFVAAALSGSSAMLTEAIHSAADSANQILLLIGQQRSKAPSDQTHNFGYGPEIYFWTFVVGVLVILAGGVVSVAQGLAQVAHPKPIESLWVSLTVLAASVVFEGGSLLVALKESGRMKRRHLWPGHRVGYWTFIKLSKDPGLYESLLEDGAALVGIAIALAGIWANAFAGWLWADGLASCLIGLLLIANGLLILQATRSLVAGEAVAPPFRKELLAAIARHAVHVDKVETLHLGPNCVLVVLTVADGPAGKSSRDLKTLVDLVRAVDVRVEHVLLRT